ncbi:MAG TPA: type II toxin-antitoxin system VapB family antitoxin [Bryobacteraceae bacterium]|jgi:antitoxin VapB
MGLNIKNKEVEQLAAEVARLANETKTEAVRRALEDRKKKLEVNSRKPKTLEEALEWMEKNIWSKLPPDVRGKPISKEEREEILGYGPGGV